VARNAYRPLTAWAVPHHSRRLPAAPDIGPVYLPLRMRMGNQLHRASGNRTCSPREAEWGACIPGNQECTAENYCTAAGICTDHLGVEGDPCGTILGEYVSCQGASIVTPPLSQAQVVATPRKHKGPPAPARARVLGYHGHCDSLTSKCISCDG